jgi:ribulose-5-phosphate 4-epimerase/fuculose-1-phosphate aldolase
MVDPTDQRNFPSDLSGVNIVLETWEGLEAVNKAALCIHCEVHTARPNALAGAHAHSLHGRAFSNLHRLLDPLTQDACHFNNDHRLYDDLGGVVTDREEGARTGQAPTHAEILATQPDLPD